ncbi:MAG: cysteine--tRNA ligase [Planctomycetota bacterium]|jgi:cysteinyl-tRNA synthetase
MPEPIHLYNTLTRNVAPFTPRAGEDGAPRPFGVYTCGPTVYNRVHVGNLRTFIAYDFLVRSLRARGFDVVWVMNITDVDDKTITKAREEGVALEVVTRRYEEQFLADLEALRVQRPDHMPRATETIATMIQLIRDLEAGGHAYAADGSVYFRLSAFADYGKLSGLDTSGLQTGARVAHDEYDKEEARDFVLWKGWVEGDGDVVWDSPWGKGRPGWHLECSAMARQFLGDTIDLHAGAVDLRFPHHENEIAQSEAATGKTFSRWWFHAAFLNMDGEKMSKSLGNVRSLDVAAKLGLEPADFRYWALSAQYRHEISFSPDDLAAKARERAGLLTMRRRLADAPDGKAGAGAQAAKAAREAFDAAITDDLNTSQALAALNGLRGETNRLLDAGEFTARDADAVEAVFDWADRHFAAFQLPEVEPLSDALAAKIADRDRAREAKDWAAADRLRDALAEAGVTLEDTPAGTRWRRR